MWPQVLLRTLAPNYLVRKDNMDLAPISKAIAGGIVGLVVALVARFGWQPDAPTMSAIGVIVTSLVGYGVGHVAVYFAPKNKEKV